MSTVKVSEMSGAVLDWAVAASEGKDHSTHKDWGNAAINDLGRLSISHRNWNCAKYFEPSKKWAEGGPIVEREGITLSSPGSLVHRHGGPNAGWGPSGIWSATTWHKGVNGRRSIAHHETSPLIAAMRCYVASKLGETIEVPEHIAQAAGKGE
jgi:hypothetical protein